MDLSVRTSMMGFMVRNRDSVEICESQKPHLNFGLVLGLFRKNSCPTVFCFGSVGAVPRSKKEKTAGVADTF